MALIKCCGEIYKCRVFVLDPQDGYFECRLFQLESCPQCGGHSLELHRLDFEHEISSLKWKNAKAVKMFERFQTSIRFEQKRATPISTPASSFYLPYTDKGKVMKCYSNLSTLDVGLFDPFEGLDTIEEGRKRLRVSA